MFRKIKVFIKRKFRKLFEGYYSKRDITYLNNKNFVIISNNCWGGSLYQWYKRPYNSPFVGLFLYGPCYLKLLSNFEYYMSLELKFIKNSMYPDRLKTYPIALLDDVEVHFTHYKTEDEAKAKWHIRTERMLKESDINNYFFKICDRERVTKDLILKFHKLPFKNKLSFSLENYTELLNAKHIKVQEKDKNKECVPNGKKLFKLTFLYFDLNKWLQN